MKLKYIAVALSLWARTISAQDTYIGEDGNEYFKETPEQIQERTVRAQMEITQPFLDRLPQQRASMDDVFQTIFHKLKTASLNISMTRSFPKL
jgi:hypothetical protein